MSRLGRFLNVFRLRALQRDLDDEVRFHLEMRIEKNVRAGMSRADAEADAFRRFGRVERVTEQMREVRVMGWTDGVLQDLRYGARALRRDRLSTAAVLAMLALAIGANTAIFTLANAMWLRPLPYAHAERLVTLEDSYTKTGTRTSPTVPEYLDLRAWNRVFDAMAFLDHRDIQVTGGSEPARVFGARITASFFPLMGVDAALGRVLREDENQPGKDAVVVLADAFWRRAFAADPAIVGRELMLDGVPRTVVGVLPPGFSFDHPSLGVPEPADVYVPFLMDEYYTLRSSSHGNLRRVRTLARLKPDISLEQATADLQVWSARLVADHPQIYRRRDTGEDLGFRIDAHPLQLAIVEEHRTVGGLLFGAVAMVLLIACANAAQFLLARSFQRRDEAMVRMALGASRSRLVRQFLTEALLLAAIAGAAGLWTSRLLVGVLVALLPVQSPLLTDLRADGRVLAFTLGLSLLTATLFGLLPALASSRSAERRSLVVGRGGRSRARLALVAVEVALSMALLTGAAVLLRGLLDAQNTPRGYSPEGLTIMQVRMNQVLADYRSNGSLQFQAYADRIAAVPGVAAAAIFSGQPVMAMQTTYRVEGRDGDVAAISRNRARYDIVGPGYFDVLRIPLVDGRTFTHGDLPGRPAVAIVNAALARREWPNQSAIGKRLQVGRDLTIVGVVGDVRMYGSSLAVTPQIYVPALQNYEPNGAIVVRIAAGADAPLQALKEAIWSVAPRQAPFNIRSLDEILYRSVATPRFNTVLIGSFALLALVLSAAGVYGVVAYLVSTRTREIAIRMAIGAQRGDVFWLISGRTFVWVAAGVMVGIGAAAVAARALAGTLEGVGRIDAPTLALAAGFSVLVTVLAIAVPARRACRLDPVRALKVE